MARGAAFSTPPLSLSSCYRGGDGNSTRFRRRGFEFRIGRIWLGVRRVVRCVRSIGGGGVFAYGVGRGVLLYSNIGE